MKRIIALAALLPVCVLAQDVEEISYDHFDMNYTSTDFDNPNLDGNGYSGRFSVDIREHMFIFGEYESFELDEIDVGSTSKTIGIGSDWSLGERWSAYGALGVTQLDLDVGLGNLEDEAALLAGGVRWAVGRGFELRFGAEYADLADTGIGETSITIGGDIYLTDVVALTIEASENDEEITSFLFGLRFYPGKDAGAARQRR